MMGMCPLCYICSRFRICLLSRSFQSCACITRSLTGTLINAFPVHDAVTFAHPSPTDTILSLSLLESIYTLPVFWAL